MRGGDLFPGDTVKIIFPGFVQDFLNGNICQPLAAALNGEPDLLQRNRLFPTVACFICDVLDPVGRDRRGIFFALLGPADSGAFFPVDDVAVGDVIIPGRHQVLLDQVLDILNVEAFALRPLGTDVRDDAGGNFARRFQKRLGQYAAIVGPERLGNGQGDLLRLERNHFAVALGRGVQFKERPACRVLLAIVGVQLRSVLKSVLVKLTHHFILDLFDRHRGLIMQTFF